MRVLKSATLFTLIGIALWTSARVASTQSSTASYGVTDLGNIGGSPTVPLGVSGGAFPVVVGYGATATGDLHAFTAFNGSAPQDLGTLGGRASEARASYYGNNPVGRAQTASGPYHAFTQVYSSGAYSLQDLGTLGGSESAANGITFVQTGPSSSKYLIIGYSRTSGDAAIRAFVYDSDAATMADLGATLGGPNSSANAINNNAHVVGYADLPGGTSHHAFLFINGATQDLGTLGTTSEAIGLNDSDIVVGRSQFANGTQHAFRYQNGMMQDLGTLGGASSEAAAVSPAGLIVGWAETSAGVRHAFLWRDGVMTDLNTLIPSASGWELRGATAIGTGNAGRETIVGYGQVQGQSRAFFLTPPLDLSLSLSSYMGDVDANFPNPHEAGSELTMVSSVLNNEPYNATNVVVRNTFTGPVQIDNWSTGQCTLNGLQLTCNIGTVYGAGYARDLAIGVHATGPGSITHSASIVSADQPDPSTGNNSRGPESNTAVSLATLTLAKTTAAGGESVLSRATLTSPAPNGGATVHLTSSNPAVASVPSQFEVLPGCCDNGTWREFYVTTHAVSAPVTVQIGATYGGVTRTVNLTVTPSATTSPFSGNPAPIPGTIQAEDFDNGGQGVAYQDNGSGNNGGAYRSTDVDIEATTDTGGGYDVGWMTAGEWLNYTVSVSQTGSYILTARVAANGAGGTFHIEIGGVDKTGPLTVPNTGGWQSWVDTAVVVSLTAGTQTMRIVEDANSPAGVFGNFNYVRLALINNGGGPTAFPSGTPWRMPGTIPASNFDNGGEGVAYHDSGIGNNGGTYRSTDVDIETSSDPGGGYTGGNNVGWMTAGEWLNYTVSVAQSGTYTLTARVAANGAGGTFHVEVGGVNKTGSLTIPNTGGWQSWTNVVATVSLTSGVQSLRFVADANGPTGVFGNFRYITLDATTAAPANIVLYSTDLALHGAWAWVSDATGAGGQHVFTPDNGWSTTSAPLAAPADYFEASFDAPAATPYTIWFRIRATSNSKLNESVWVQFSDALASGSAVYPLGSTSGLLVNLEPCNACGVSGWGWQNGAYWLSQVRTVSFATSATHTIRVQVREDGAQIDQVVLSPSQYLSAAPGPVKDDATIVPK